MNSPGGFALADPYLTASASNSLQGSTNPSGTNSPNSLVNSPLTSPILAAAKDPYAVASEDPYGALADPYGASDSMLSALVEDEPADVGDAVDGDDLFNEDVTAQNDPALQDFMEQQLQQQRVSADYGEVAELDKEDEEAAARKRRRIEAAGNDDSDGDDEHSPAWLNLGVSTEGCSSAMDAEVCASYLDGLGDMEDADEAYAQYIPRLAQYLIGHPEGLISKSRKRPGKGAGKRFWQAKSDDVMADKVATGCWACGKLDHQSNECVFKRCFVCSEQGHEFTECTKKSIRCRRCLGQGHTMDQCPKETYRDGIGNEIEELICRCIKCGEEGHLNCGEVPSAPSHEYGYGKAGGAVNGGGRSVWRPPGMVAPRSKAGGYAQQATPWQQESQRQPPWNRPPVVLTPRAPAWAPSPQHGSGYPTPPPRPSAPTRVMARLRPGFVRPVAANTNYDYEENDDEFNSGANKAPEWNVEDELDMELEELCQSKGKGAFGGKSGSKGGKYGGCACGGKAPWSPPGKGGGGYGWNQNNHGRYGQSSYGDQHSQMHTSVQNGKYGGHGGKYGGAGPCQKGKGYQKGAVGARY